MEPQEGAREGLRGLEHVAARAGRCARRGRARVREVVLDLTAHSLDLLRDPGRHVGLAARGGALGLVREDGQRRLQAVREIARLGVRATDGAFLVREQRVQVGDERLHFSREAPFDALRLAGADGRQPPAHFLERHESAPHDREAREHGGDRRDHQRVRIAVDRHEEPERLAVERERHAPRPQKPERPQDRADHDVDAQRLHWRVSPHSIR